MLSTLQIATLVCVALTMATAVAHALELPGKLRLPKEIYLAVQPIDLRTAQVAPRGADWQQLRDRWEYSHVARAALSLAALILLSAIALS